MRDHSFSRIFLSVVHLVIVVFCCSTRLQAQSTFFHESFDDDAYEQRGWYDNNYLIIDSTEHIPGSAASLKYHFLKGARTANGGAVRRLFTPSPEVYLSFWIKYSVNWTGSNKPYHPHQFHFVTTEDDRYVGPSYTHLTLYIEENERRPLLAMQDSKNIDTAHIKQDISKTTELRAVAGCNGSSDAYPTGDCYPSNNLWFNGKQWVSPKLTFLFDKGPYYQNDWHHVEAYFRLNSIVDDKAIADGIAQYWFDDSLLISAQNIMLRTAQHPSMMFNQFLIAPYIGDGSPVEQTMWVDEVRVGDRRPSVTTVSENLIDEWTEYEVVVVDILGRYCKQYTSPTTTRAALQHTALDGLSNGVYCLQLRNLRTLSMSTLLLCK